LAKLVYPGTQLAYEEELAGDENTYNEDGRVYAAMVGEQREDAAKRSVSVAKKGRSVRGIKTGDPVYGIIADIYEQIALVRFQPADASHAANRTFCYIRISEVSHNYAREFRDYFKIGDFIKARVKEVKELGTYLTIVDDDLGVIRAFCSRDRTELSQEGVCPKCKGRERRKWAGRPEQREERGGGGRREGGFRGRDGGRGREGGGFRGRSERGGGSNGFSRGPRREGRGGFRR